MAKYAPIVAAGNAMDTAITAAITNEYDQSAAVAVFAACFKAGTAAGTPLQEQNEYVFTVTVDSEPTSTSVVVSRARTLPA